MQSKSLRERVTWILLDEFDSLLNSLASEVANEIRSIPEGKSSKRNEYPASKKSGNEDGREDARVVEWSIKT